MNKKKVEEYNLIEHIRKYFAITPFKPIIEWCEQNIDFSQQISAQRNRLDFDLYPYQKDILKEWQMKPGIIKTIVVVAPEQTGKTNIFVCGSLYNMIYSPCQSMIVYPSDDLAETTNKTKLFPLMKHIPALKEQLDKPRSFRSDCYRFSNLVSYFQGAGSKIVSKSCKIVVGDEVDAWPAIPGVDNVADLKKRTRSYNSSICFLISTPKYQSGKIWKAFQKGSQGYWYLRCKGCGQLTMRSCDIHNLQFESDEVEGIKERVVRPQTIRLICPKCGYEHVEADKAWCNKNGAFIHKIPQRLQKAPSFQLGALASQLRSIDWQFIANKQLEAGKKAEQSAQQQFDNSVRGLPYKPRQIQKDELQTLRDHQWKESEAPQRDRIEMVFVTADTQDDRSVVGVWAMDVEDNLYLLKTAEPRHLTLDQDERDMINAVAKQEAMQKNVPFIPVETVQDILNAEYLKKDGVGIVPTFIVLDARGHRMPQILKFVNSHINAMAWMGANMKSTDQHWKQIVDDPQKPTATFLCNARHYQAEEIFYLYTNKNRHNQYLYFYPNIEKEVIEQIRACQPNQNSKFGHYPQNWQFGNRVHDYFDVTKMAYFARQYAIKKMTQFRRFRFHKSPKILQKLKQIETGESPKKQQKPPEKRWINAQYYK